MGDLIKLSDRRLRLEKTAGNVMFGAQLRWKRYRAWAGPDHIGECAICWTPFSQDGAPGTLHSGYSVMGGGPAGQDDYRWICAVCYEDLGERFGWTVVGPWALPASRNADRN